MRTSREPLAAHLRVRGLSQSAVAKAIGVHTNTVYCWANGRTLPTADNLTELVEALDADVRDLFSPASLDELRRRQERQL